MPSTLESKIAVLESRLETHIREGAERGARFVTLTETVARLTVLQEERARRDAQFEQKIDRLVEQGNTPPPAQDRLIKLLEEQARKAEDVADRERERTQEITRVREAEDSKSDKWMREIVLILISSLVGGGVLSGVRDRLNMPLSPPPAIEESIDRDYPESARGVTGIEAAPSHQP